MLKCIRDNVLCLPPELIAFVLRHSLGVVLGTFVLTIAIAVYTISNFSINTDLNDMISEDLPFRQNNKVYDEAFPQLSDTLDIVIDGKTPELAMHGQKVLAQELLKNKDMFKNVYIPGGGEFFDKNGLFFMSVEELEDLTDNLAEAQPFLGILSKDWSLNGLFSALNKIVQNTDESVYGNKSLILLYNRLSHALENTIKGKPSHISWQEIMLGKAVEKNQLRQFIIVQPVLDYSALYPGEKALDMVHSLVKKLDLTEEHGVQVRMTGAVALDHDDLVSVQNGIGIASLISSVLLFVALYLGLNSMGMVLISLVTIFIGLIWTMGFAIAFIGSLNLLSITFAVLFIGLGDEFIIQYCLRYKELVEAGYSNSAAISTAAQGVWNALYLCAITTAIGFFAFVPTDYVGASELGLISGTGMFISLLTTVTLLPALLNIFHYKKTNKKLISVTTNFLIIPEKYAALIGTSALVIGFLATFLLTRVFFDFNPLALSDPEAESVKTAKELFNDEESPPWTISVIAPDHDKAKNLADSLSKLKEVDNALIIDDFMPNNQDEKAELIEDMALFMPPSGFNTSLAHSYNDTLKVLKNFEASLKEYLTKLPELENDYISSLRLLYTTLREFNLFIENSKDGEFLLRSLERRLLSNLSILLNNLEKLLEGEPFEESDLPKQLRERYVSDDGRYRIEVFPRENLNDIASLERFIASVRTIAPEATGSPVSMLESGNAVFSAFKYATAYAFVLIVIFLYVVLRKIFDVILIMIPIIMSLILTSSLATFIGIPYNFANIIVIPLMLGVGVDYSIHVLHRFRSDPLAGKGILDTSTARAVFFSALTTIVSFGSLSILDHQGTASIGKLLTISMIFIIISVLVVLPALLRLQQNSLEAKAKRRK